MFSLTAAFSEGGKPAGRLEVLSTTQCPSKNKELRLIPEVPENRTY